MAMYPNGRYMSRSPGRHFGVAPGLDVYYRGRNDRFNQHASDSRLKTASSPDGYDVEGLVPAMRAGSMSALTKFKDATFTGAMLQAVTMDGSGSFNFVAPDGNLSLVVSMSGTATITFTGNASVLRLVIGMDGSGTMSVTGAGGLSLKVPFDGTGVMSLIGTGDLRGTLKLEGSWTPFSELSPEGLAAAVWGAVAASNNEAGTMGNKLNSAASGGVDYTALGVAVWASVSRTLTAGAAPDTTAIANAVLAALNATSIPVDMVKVRGQALTGTGAESDPWGPGG